MASHNDDVVFLVRMRRQDGSKSPIWRGSVYEVATGRRLYVSNCRDAADFIDARLAELNDAPDGDDAT